MIAFAELYGTTLDFIASRLGTQGGAAAKNELEGSLLLIARELPREEVEVWVKLMLTRLRDKLKPS